MVLGELLSTRCRVLGSQRRRRLEESLLSLATRSTFGDVVYLLVFSSRDVLQLQALKTYLDLTHLLQVCLHMLAFACVLLVGEVDEELRVAHHGKALDPQGRHCLEANDEALHMHGVEKVSPIWKRIVFVEVAIEVNCPSLGRICSGGKGLIPFQPPVRRVCPFRHEVVQGGSFDDPGHAEFDVEGMKLDVPLSNSSYCVWVVQDLLQGVSGDDIDRVTLEVVTQLA